MAKRECPLDGRLTTCTEACSTCLKDEEKKERENNNANTNS